MSTWIATSDYEVIDRSPLSLETGEVVKVGPPDSDWPGWTWVVAPSGRGSHVPDDLLTPLPDGTARITSPFQARDLSVRKGQRVTALREVKGWLWCQSASGEEGWLPSYLLKADS
jgi:hypothetical protein